MSKLRVKTYIHNMLDKTDLDEKLVEKANQTGDFVEETTDEVKSFFTRLKETFGFWSIIEIGTILFIVIPALSGDYNIAFGASLVWVALHKFNKNWIK